MGKKIFWFVPAGIVMTGIFLLSTFLSVPVQIGGISYIDKWQHCFAYCVLIISFMWAFRQANLLSFRLSIYLLIGGSVYGFLLELTQYNFFPGRYFEWIDAVANVLGVFIGFSIFRWFFNGR